jgi:hypothetical protein
LVAEAWAEQRQARRTKAPVREPAAPVGAALLGVSGLVALGGLAMYPDPEISEALIPPAATGRGTGGAAAGGCGGGSGAGTAQAEE